MVVGPAVPSLPASLCRSSFSQHSPSLLHAPARLSRRRNRRAPCTRTHAHTQLSPGNSWTELSSHWLHHRLQPWGCLGSVLLYLPSLSRLFLCLCARKCVFPCVRVFACVCVCVCAGDTRHENSWITEARQDCWTALEQMVDELDQGIKTPEIENASVADGWDCGIVSWGLGAWALLCSVFFFSFLPLLFAMERNVSPSLLKSIPDSPCDRPQHISGQPVLMWQWTSTP